MVTGPSGCGQWMGPVDVVTWSGHWVWSVGDIHCLSRNEVSLLLLCLCFLAASSLFSVPFL